MQAEDIKQCIENGIPGSTVILDGEGCEAKVTVISGEFEGKTLLQQQRMVYATLGDAITSGAVHALSIKSYTPAQWSAVEQQ